MCNCELELEFTISMLLNCVLGATLISSSIYFWNFSNVVSSSHAGSTIYSVCLHKLILNLCKYLLLYVLNTYICKEFFFGEDVVYDEIGFRVEQLTM